MPDLDAPNESLPVAVIGGGPVGLVAAARLVDRGIDAVVLERGDRVGAHVAEWDHVRLFTPWRWNVDATALRLLRAAAWEVPDPDAHPTGAEWRQQYLEPLAASRQIARRLHLRTEVTAVSRAGSDKRTGPERRHGPFRLTVACNGTTDDLLARAVIDASGTWASPNPVGADGTPAHGERAAASRLRYGIPDVLGRERPRYRNRDVAVVGSGHSAQQAVRDLVRLGEQAPRTSVTWVVRHHDSLDADGAGSADPLPARAELAAALREIVASAKVRVAAGFRTRRIEVTGGQVSLEDDVNTLGPFDEIVVATGFRPDLRLLRELQVDLDPAFEAPPGIAPLIDPTIHTCATVPMHGWRDLQHPEPDLWIVGMKSYGRAPTFLAHTGYAQVASIVDHMSGCAPPAEPGPYAGGANCGGSTEEDRRALAGYGTSSCCPG
jgi:cation diffusion facilitator CzcD-associated flavoprotein CzcO